MARAAARRGWEWVWWLLAVLVSCGQNPASLFPAALQARRNSACRRTRASAPTAAADSWRRWRRSGRAQGLQMASQAVLFTVLPAAFRFVEFMLQPTCQLPGTQHPAAGAPSCRGPRHR